MVSRMRQYRKLVFSAWYRGHLHRTTLYLHLILRAGWFCCPLWQSQYINKNKLNTSLASRKLDQRAKCSPEVHISTTCIIGLRFCFQSNWLQLVAPDNQISPILAKLREALTAKPPFHSLLTSLHVLLNLYDKSWFTWTHLFITLPDTPAHTQMQTERMVQKHQALSKACLNRGHQTTTCIV